jgi:hypothetical protein
MKEVLIRNFHWTDNKLYYDNILILKIKYDEKKLMYKIFKSIIWYSGLWILVDDITYIKNKDDLKSEIEKKLYSFSKSFISYYEKNQR